MFKQYLPDLASRVLALSTSPWRFLDITFVLYGLQDLVVQNDGYLDIVSTMTKIGSDALKGEGVVTSHDLSIMLYGLQTNKCDDDESLNLLKVMTQMITRCIEPMSSHAVGNSLYGMRSMTSESAEVRALLSALAVKVTGCEETLNAQAVSNALYGLQGMSYECLEVKALVSALVAKAQRCKQPLKAQAVGNALYGIIGLAGSTSFLEIINVLKTSMVKLASTPNQIELRNDMDGDVCLAQGIALSLPALRDSLNDDDYTTWVTASMLLDDHLSSQKNITGGHFRSEGEKKLFTLCAGALENSGVTVSHYEHLLNIFESDIVVRIPMGSGDSLVLNIEVDGEHHLCEKSKRFCMLRDEYLKSKGVVVERLDTGRLRKMSDVSIEKWVLAKVAAAALSPSI